VTSNTVNGVFSFGVRFGSYDVYIYRAEFAGDSQYGASEDVVYVSVRPITTTTEITASKTNLFPNEPVTFTVTVKAGSTVLTKPVHMYYYRLSPWERHEVGDGNMVNGAYSFTLSFTEPDSYDVHVAFMGDAQYEISSNFVRVYVQPDIS